MCASICALQKPLEPLKDAIDKENVEGLQALLRQIKDPRGLNDGIDDGSNTLLHIAAQKNFLGGVRALIESGAHPKVTNMALVSV